MSNNILEEYFIWDENDCTKQSQNNYKHEEKDNCVTTNETKNDSTPKDLKSTTNVWVRNCPKCNKELQYNYESSFLKSYHNNKLCRSCTRTGTLPSNKKHFKLTRNCPRCDDVIYYPNGNVTFKAEKSKRLCQKCAGNYRRYSSNSKDWNKNCPNCGKLQIYKNLKSFKEATSSNRKCIKCATKEACNKDYIRTQRRERRLGQHTPQFNFDACTYFESLNKQNDWNLQHALNGGEIRIIGYSLDAYDKERNIVVEYDEPTHYNNIGQLKQKDVLRQQRIITHLGCRFFRYNERTKELYEVKTSMM